MQIGSLQHRDYVFRLPPIVESSRVDICTWQFILHYLYITQASESERGRKNFSLFLPPQLQLLFISLLLLLPLKIDSSIHHYLSIKGTATNICTSIYQSSIGQWKGSPRSREWKKEKFFPHKGPFKALIIIIIIMLFMSENNSIQLDSILLSEPIRVSHGKLRLARSLLRSSVIYNSTPIVSQSLSLSLSLNLNAEPGCAETAD